MVLRVIDDGIGLPKALKPQQGLGFHIMNYRAQLMGGRLEIDSAQKGGTRVSCYLPVHAAQSNKPLNGDGLNGDVPEFNRASRPRCNFATSGATRERRMRKRGLAPCYYPRLCCNRPSHASR